MEHYIHRPKISEKLFFLISGAIISVPFAILTNGLVMQFIGRDFRNIVTSFLAIAIAAPFLEACRTVGTRIAFCIAR